MVWRSLWSIVLNHFDFSARDFVFPFWIWPFLNLGYFASWRDWKWEAILFVNSASPGLFYVLHLFVCLFQIDSSHLAFLSQVVKRSQWHLHHLSYFIEFIRYTYFHVLQVTGLPDFPSLPRVSPVLYLPIRFFSLSFQLSLTAFSALAWWPFMLLSDTQSQSQCHVCPAFVTVAPYFWYYNLFQ